MDRFHTSLVAEGLIAYAIERQNGFERYQQKGFPPWAERRRLWTDAILQGMAKLEGETPDPKLMERYDHELEATRWSSFTVPASPQLQQKTIRNLRRFVSALEFAGGDRRRQVNMVWKLLDDMSSHLPWTGKDNSLDRARDEAECALFRMTAQLPICFTRVLLGGDAGPHWVSGFVSGSVTDADAVKRTAVYREALQQYPEIKEWPALCTVCVGRNLPSAIGSVSACAFDLEIMNRIGDRFLKEQGVQQVYARQMIIPTLSAMTKPGKGLPTASWSSMRYPLPQGSRSLTAADLDVQERISVEDERINFRLDIFADERSAFGRQLSSEEEGSYIQAYTSYTAATGQVDNTLDIVVRSPGGDADGWKTWSMQDVSAAVYHAYRKKYLCGEQYMARFLGKLDGRELSSAGHLSARDISFADGIIEMRNRLNFCLESSDNVKTILGNLVRLEGPDDWINLYADYDCAEKQVCDVLSIELHHADGRQEELAYPLNAAEKTVLFRNLGMYRTPDLSF